MNILMIHPHDLYSDLEPWTRRIKYIAKEFVKKGHNVKLIYFPLNGFTQNGAFDSSDISDTYEEIALNRKKYALLRNIWRMKHLAGWADVIHFQKCFSHASLPSLLAGWLEDKPVHYDWDDWELAIYNYDAPSKLIGRYLGIVEKALPSVVDTISVTSMRLKELCLDLGFDARRIFDSHVGADLELFNPNIDGSIVRKRYYIRGPLVLYLGQLHGAQYVELFLKSAKIVLERGIDADFMVVGHGFRLPYLKNLAEELGIERKVVFTKAVPHEEVPQYIAASDIAVACFEDNEITRCKSPLKIAEYLACGKPIVASDLGEVRKMVDGCGILTRPGDAGSLSEGITRLLEDGGLRVELGRKARLRAEEKYNWKVTAENLLAAYGCGLNHKSRTIF